MIIYNYLIHGVIPKQKEYTLGLNWINIYTDFFFSLQSILKGKGNIKDFYLSYRKFTEACWDKRDPIPFFVYALMIINFLRRR